MTICISCLYIPIDSVYCSAKICHNTILAGIYRIAIVMIEITHTAFVGPAGVHYAAYDIFYGTAYIDLPTVIQARRASAHQVEVLTP
jgi:hypothetical protein